MIGRSLITFYLVPKKPHQVEHLTHCHGANVVIDAGITRIPIFPEYFLPPVKLEIRHITFKMLLRT